MCMRYYLEAVSMKPTNSVLAAGVSLSLVLGSVPAVAFADEPKDTAVEQDASQPETNETSAESLTGDALLSDGASQPDGLPESSYDKADFYQGSYESAVVSTFALRSVGLQPREISKDMLYFGAFEGGTYDRTFSYGDGYHAMGYYQFDHRYGLKNFLLACYEYNPGKYAMFAQFANISDAQFKAENAIRNNGAFTALGTSLINAWKAAYAADSYEFSRLQDDWAYTSYYLPAERYLASRGIDISDRSDAVKGLCWGLSNLFGQSGWRKFVGGVSDGYDWNGTYHYLSEGYQWPGCGLSDDMTDKEFVTTLCNYVVDNVAVFYKGQPQYHEGWQNRYKKELNQCLAIINRTGDTHAKPESNDEGVLGGGESNEESGSNDGSSQGGSSSDDALSQGEGSNGNDSSQNDNSNDEPSGNDGADALPNGNDSHEEPGAGGPSDGNTSDGESDAGSNDSDLGDNGSGADVESGTGGESDTGGHESNEGNDSAENGFGANNENAGGSNSDESDDKGASDEETGGSQSADGQNNADVNANGGSDDSRVDSGKGMGAAGGNENSESALSGSRQVNAESDASSSESEKPKKISEMVKTSDGLGTIISGFAAATAALVAMGVVALRMRARRQ